MLEESSGPSTVAYRKEGTRTSLLDLIDNVANNGLTTIEESVEQQNTVVEGPTDDKESNEEGKTDLNTAVQPGATKLSWVEGVFIPCLLNIWGVIMFLRIGWVVGQAGVYQAILIVTCSKVVTTITALSLCAICTNGEVKGGGVYFLISRALGPVYGGTIGVLFFVAQAVATSLYVIGFAESLSALLVESGVPLLFEDPLNDVRLIGLITTVLLLAVAMVGVGWYAKCQVGLLVTLVVSMLSVMIGAFVPDIGDAERSLSNQEAGFVGIDKVRNLYDLYDETLNEHSFFTVFAVFFPAATGVMAGANLSGDLKDPSHAIPKGTLGAISLTYVSYVLLCILMGFACLACSDLGDEEEYCSAEGEDYLKASGGLLNAKLIMRNVSLWSPLFYVGVFAATLSSALASLVGAPRILQSVAGDEVFPWQWFTFFGEGRGRNNEPVRAYVLTFVITCGCVVVGKLDVIAPLISNFFMISYAFTNYACFSSSIAYYPGWRPSFKYYNKWLSLFGFVLCVVVMFLMEYVTSIITLLMAGSLYMYLSYLDPDVNWGAAGEARNYFSTLKNMERLQHGRRQHVKTYRPQYLVMSGPPAKGSSLIKFASLLSKGGGVTICADVIRTSEIELENHESNIGRFVRKGVVQLEGIGSSTSPRSNSMASHSELASLLAMRQKAVIDHRVAGDEFLGNKRIWGGKSCPGAFFEALVSDDLVSGFNSLLQTSGLGLLRPNTIILGYKEDWDTVDESQVKEYEQVIRIALASELGILILRDDLGQLDFDAIPEKSRIQSLTSRGDRTASDSISIDGTEVRPAVPTPNETDRAQRADHDLSTQAEDKTSPTGGEASSDTTVDTSDDASDDAAVKAKEETNGESATVSPPLTSSKAETSKINISNKVKKYRSFSNHATYNIVGDTVDVWWISDDGGLTMLIPYLLTQHRLFRKKKLRVLTVTNYNVEETSKLQKTEFRMVHLLKKFRIEAEVVAVQVNLSAGCSNEMMEEFNSITKVPMDALTVQEQLKTKHILCLADVVRQYTNPNSAMVFLTLPLPDTGIPVGLYSSWLHILSTSLPPVVFIRGSGDQVLTFVC